MKNRWIAIFATLTFISACGDSANQSTTNQDSTTITTNPNNTTVSPGTAEPGSSPTGSGQDTGRNGMQDSSMNHLDSGNLNKR